MLSAGQRETAHEDAWGDPLGDNKIEYRSPEGRNVVLKLKTAPDPASGILDQYELGPYNLMILGEPSRWRGEFHSFFDAGIVQQGGGAGALLGDDRPHEPRPQRLLHLHRRHGALDAGGAPRGGAGPHGEASRSPCSRSPPISKGWPRRKKMSTMPRALLKAMGIKVAHIATAVGEPAEK